MRTDLDKNKEAIIEALTAGIPRTELCRKYKCKYDTLKSRLKLWNVNHLKNPSRKGIPHTESYKHSSQYLNKDSNISSHRLKLKLIKDNIKIHQCENCKNTTWMGKPIPIELNHKDGNHFNNELNNLEIVCPNCHAQEPTSSGKNKGHYADVL